MTEDIKAQALALIEEMRQAEHWGGDQCENGSQEAISDWAERLDVIVRGLLDEIEEWCKAVRLRDVDAGHW